MVRLNTGFKSRKAPAVAKTGSKAATLEITLRYIRPRIWRQFVVPQDIGLFWLHQVIQMVMGWTDSHLHAFRKGAHEYTACDPDDVDCDQTLSRVIIHNEAEHTLADLASRVRARCQYDYDFGDGWEHDLKVLKIETTAERLTHVRCLAGARACPPEDCGGPWGYADLVEIMTDPRHERYAEMMEWLGDEFDPAHFDLAETNVILARMPI